MASSLIQMLAVIWCIVMGPASHNSRQVTSHSQRSLISIQYEFISMGVDWWVIMKGSCWKHTKHTKLWILIEAAKIRHFFIFFGKPRFKKHLRNHRFQVLQVDSAEIFVFDFISKICPSPLPFPITFSMLLRFHSKVVMGNFLSDAEGGMKLRGRACSVVGKCFGIFFAWPKATWNRHLTTTGSMHLGKTPNTEPV